MVILSGKSRASISAIKTNDGGNSWCVGFGCNSNSMRFYESRKLWELDHLENLLIQLIELAGETGERHEIEKQGDYDNAVLYLNEKLENADREAPAFLSNLQIA